LTMLSDKNDQLFSRIFKLLVKNFAERNTAGYWYVLFMLCAYGVFNFRYILAQTKAILRNWNLGLVF
jgi:hypothetical protein